MLQQILPNKHVLITFTEASMSQAVPIGTMPIHQVVQTGHNVEMYELCESPQGALFGQSSLATSKSISLTVAFKYPRAWADLVVPALTYFHNSIVVRCAAAIDTCNKNLIIIMGKSGAGKTSILNYLVLTSRYVIPLADDHLGVTYHSGALSVFTPIWDRYGHHSRLYSNIKLIKIIVLSDKIINAQDKWNLFIFMMSQTLCSTIHNNITLTVLELVEKLLSKSEIYYFSEIRTTPLDKICKIARI